MDPFSLLKLSRDGASIVGKKLFQDGSILEARIVWKNGHEILAKQFSNTRLTYRENGGGEKSGCGARSRKETSQVILREVRIALRPRRASGVKRSRHTHV